MAHLTTSQSGKLGELVASVHLSRPVGGRYRRSLFEATSLGGTYPSVDLLVDVLDPSNEPIGFFFARVKATQSASQSGARLSLTIEAERFRRLTRLRAPAYLIGVDLLEERSYILGATAPAPATVPSIPRDYPLTDDKIEWRSTGKWYRFGPGGRAAAGRSLAMSSRANAKSKPREPRYVGWRGELIAKMALTRAGLVVQDSPPPQPFDLLVSTPDGFYFLVEVNAYSSMHGGRRPIFNGSSDHYSWPVESSVLRAAGEVNLPVVLFVIDADREFGHYARLDRLPPPSHDQRTPSVSLAASQDLSPEALATLISGLRQDWAVSRRPA